MWGCEKARASAPLATSEAANALNEVGGTLTVTDEERIAKVLFSLHTKTVFFFLFFF